jgi:hypothetical protein
VAVAGGSLELLVLEELGEPLLEQPANATTARLAAMTANRRIMNS